MKTIVCGKGGCGKSAITSLLAKEISRQGFKVIVADNDESNFGLHTYLRLDLPKDLVDYFGGSDEIFGKIDEIEASRVVLMVLAVIGLAFLSLILVIWQAENFVQLTVKGFRRLSKVHPSRGE